MPRYRQPRTPGVPGASATYRFAAGIAFGQMHLQRWRFDVAGAHHVPTSGGAVIAANHTSFWDFFVAGRHGYYALGRPIRIMAKASLFEKPVFGTIMKRAEHIPVHRGEGADALRSAVEALEAGELVLVLPEQTISPSVELLPFKTGAARMAARAGVPIIPTATWGTHRFHTVRRKPRPRWRLPVSIAYGEPLRPREGEDADLVTARLRTQVHALHTQLVRDYPDGTPAGAWWVPERFGGGAPTPEEADAYVDGIRSRFGRERRRRAS